MDEPRYRCDGCGNLTRFDVTTSQTTKAFHHYTVGGELEVEEATVLSRHVDEVVCRWCGHGRSVAEIGDADTDMGVDGDEGAGVDGDADRGAGGGPGGGASGGRAEPSAHSQNP
jgi:hypothetical protein